MSDPVTRLKLLPGRPTGAVPTSEEDAGRAALWLAMQEERVAPNEQLENLGLFVRRQVWCRWLWMHHLYQMALPVHGVVMELGCRWGQNLALWSSFRGIYEPFNHNRRIVGFDSFAGFPSIGQHDGNAKAGDYGTSLGYDEHLRGILRAHETQSPVSHICKHEIVKGDVRHTVPRWLTEHPEAIVALAYFDLDLYEPTKSCLAELLPRFVKGSVVGFDELNHAPFPGETLAFREVLGSARVRRVPYSPTTSYVVIGD